MTEKLFKKLDYGFGWLAFAIAAVVYLMTLEPTVSFWDCGEFISSSYKLEVGHPPGAPFFMIIARFFAMFASGPEQVAHMVNAFSGIVSAFTIMFLYWSIAYFAKRMIAPDGNYNTGKTIAIIGASMLGAMAYTFSDTFWFSAVEGEVYAFSSFFTAIVFWAILKWSDSNDDLKASRWILLISLLVGMSIGVHLLNLLSIPAIAFVFYYKKFKPNFWGFVITTAVSLVIVAMIMWGIIPGVAVIASKIELFLVNGIGMPYNSGLFVWAMLCMAFLGMSIYVTHYSDNKIFNIIIPSVALVLIGAPFMSGNIFLNILLLGGFVYGIIILVKKKKQVLNLIMISFTMIMIGYSSYALIVIRSNANPPMDQNNPDDVFNLLYYLNREQYGDRPLIYGQYFNAERESDSEGSPIYIKKDGKYVIVSYKPETNYNEEYCTVFPRMYSPDPEHVKVYRNWCGMEKTQTEIDELERKIDMARSGGEYPESEMSLLKALESKKPTFAQNIRFTIQYQLDWMYWRYFMWNFAGRQNDIQGKGNLIHGNWISGISSIDNSRLGDQNKLPDYLKANKSNNKYYMLPLLLGLIGLGYQLFKNLKDWWIVSLLFILTGIAIVVYLNQTPNQPRERDYAYAGSFYAFAIWIGLSIIAVYDLLKRFSPAVIAGSVATLICLPVPYIMAKENWDDHDRSNRYIARDFAYNYLMSCAPNAILFTYGDNDTFPIWYAQEVEGIRPDVKVCCLPYFASDWYIDQMKQASYDAAPMPLSVTRDKYEPSVRDALYYDYKLRKDASGNIVGVQPEDPGYISIDSLLNYIVTTDKKYLEAYSMTDYSYPRNKIFIKVDSMVVVNNGTVRPDDSDKIDSVIKFDLASNHLFKNSWMTLDMLRTNNWNRPVYFTSIGSSNTLGLDNYFQNEGFAYRLVPIKSNSKGRIDKEIMYDNLMNKFRWGNMNDPNIIVDNTINRTVRTVKIRDNFRDLAIMYAADGDTVKAKSLIAKCDDLMPANIYTPGLFDIEYANAYYATGDFEKGDNFLREIIKVTSQELDFFFSLDRGKQKSCEYEMQLSMYTYSRVLQNAVANNRTALIEELRPKYDEYSSQYGM